MAQSPFKAPRHFGTEIGINSLPYTAEKDGFIRLICNPKNANAAFVICTAGYHTYRVNSFNGYDEHTYVPINAGDTISITSSDNCNVYQYYMPIEGGGNCKVTPCSVAQVAA